MQPLGGSISWRSEAKSLTTLVSQASIPMRHPALRLDDRFTHLVFAGGSVVLVADDDSVLLETPVAADVVRLLDGRSTAVEIAEALGDRHPPEIVHFILLSLDRAKLTRAHAESPTEEVVEASWSPANRLATTLHRAWGQRPASVVTTPLELPLGDGVHLILTDDYLSPDIAAYLTFEGASTTSVVLGRLGMERVWLGPVFGRDGSACVHCLQARLRLNLAGRALLHLGERANQEDLRIERLDRVVPFAAFERLSRGLLETLGIGRSLADALLVLPIAASAGEELHPVRRDPGCPVCGNPHLNPPGAELHLSPVTKVEGSGGGYRGTRVEQTLNEYASLVSSLTGVVRGVRRLDVDDPRVIHVYTASHARDFKGGIRALRADRRDAAGGKGRSDLDARVSAICEALERYSAIHRGDEPCRVGRHSDFGAQAVDPFSFLLFSDHQYRHRDEWNATASGMQWIPEPYDDQVIEWSPTRSLVTGDVRFVPSAAVYLGFNGEGTRYCRGDSNGLSGGNSIEEAILQGLLELIERDAVALWWYNRCRRPAVDIDSFGDAYLLDVASHYHARGRRLWALDLTTDIGVPCFAALAARTGHPREEIIFGFGAHLDAGIALSRAITELNQILPTVLRSEPDRRAQLLPEFADALSWWANATLALHEHLLPTDSLRPRRASDFETSRTTDLLQDIVSCADRVHAAGADVLVHDLTRPDVGLSVARVLAPGLRHFWRRLAPGRLYDVPLRLRWIDRKLDERELNPVSIFV